MFHNALVRKSVVLGIIIVLLEISIIPIAPGDVSKQKKSTVECNEDQSADAAITDWVQDVCQLDFETKNWSITTSSPYVVVDNIDLVAATWNHLGTQVTLCLQVAGIIENRGSLRMPLDIVLYSFNITTSERFYVIAYYNYTCELFYGNVSIDIPPSNFSCINNTLSVSFSLMNASEICEDFDVGAGYLKLDFFNKYEWVELSDIAPNPPSHLVFFLGLIRNLNTTHDYITFSPRCIAAVWFLPFHMNTSSSEQILVSLKYHGFLGQRIICGLFRVSVLLPEEYYQKSPENRIIKLVWRE